MTLRGTAWPARGLVLWETEDRSLLMLAVPPDASPRLRAAMTRWRDAALAGRCECGAEVEAQPQGPGRPARAVWRHTPDCDADDQRLAFLMATEAEGEPHDQSAD